MKKITKMLALVFTCCLIFNCAKVAVMANTYVSDNIALEYDINGITLPVLKLDGNAQYKVEVFNYEDDKYAKCIFSGMFIEFTNIGKYRVRYTIKDGGNTSYEYSILNISDTTIPVVSIVNMKTTYKIGESIILNPKIIDNTAHLAKKEYTLIRNGENYTNEITENQFTIKQSGEYSLRVKVIDAGNNVSYATYPFSVAETTVKKNKGCNKNKTSMSFIALAISSIIIIKKKMI